MTGYALYHGRDWKADTLNLEWLRTEAMPFHRSDRASDVFILPHEA